MLDDCPNIEFERDCPKFERISNADAIRNMSDEELAEYLSELIRNAHEYHAGEGDWLQWLKSEVKE